MGQFGHNGAAKASANALRIVAVNDGDGVLAFDDFDFIVAPAWAAGGNSPGDGEVDAVRKLRGDVGVRDAH